MERGELGDDAPSGAGQAVLGLLWAVIRIPALGLLLVLEPFVRVGLTLLAALTLFLSFFFRYLAHLPHFPFWGMLGASVGCGVVLVAYYGLIRLFSTPLTSPAR